MKEDQEKGSTSIVHVILGFGNCRKVDAYLSVGVCSIVLSHLWRINWKILYLNYEMRKCLNIS